MKYFYLFIFFLILSPYNCQTSNQTNSIVQNIITTAQSIQQTESNLQISQVDSKIAQVETLKNSSSFIESQETVSLTAEETAQLELISYLQANDQGTLSAFNVQKMALKNKRRMIDDGRICKEIFKDLSNQDVVNTCTNAKSPDGRMTGKEWCYKDYDQPGQSTWGWCDPALEYDKVRARVNQLTNQEIPELRKIEAEMIKIQKTGHQLLSIYQKIGQKQDENKSFLATLEDKLTKLKDDWSFTLDLKKQWEDLELKIAIIKEELVELKKIGDRKNEEDCEGILGYSNIQFQYYFLSIQDDCQIIIRKC